MKPRSRAPDIVALAAAAGLLVWFLLNYRLPNPIETILVTAFFGISGWISRGATLPGTLVGSVIALTYYAVGGWRLLLLLLVAYTITLAATWAGKSTKSRLGLAESATGRRPAQIFANLGVSGWLIAMSVVSSSDTRSIYAFWGVAALAQAAADTVSSEIGEAFGGQPRLITTFRFAPVGTDGGLTVAGTLAGLAAALLVAQCSRLSLEIGNIGVAIVAAAGFVGMLVDSLLGALVQRRGWIGNDAINLIGTASAPLIAIALTKAVGFFCYRLS
jgi:uncharacterized protein (TIGR00297 family)